MRIALIAHDEKKDDLVAFCLAHRGFLGTCDLVATGTTGGRIGEGQVDALVFFVDPLTPMPHDVDVKALMRLAIVYDIPMALNRATAEIILARAEGASNSQGGT